MKKNIFFAFLVILTLVFPLPSNSLEQVHIQGNLHLSEKNDEYSLNEDGSIDVTISEKGIFNINDPNLNTSNLKNHEAHFRINLPKNQIIIPNSISISDLHHPDALFSPSNYGQENCINSFKFDPNSNTIYYCISLENLEAHIKYKYTIESASDLSLSCSIEDEAPWRVGNQLITNFPIQQEPYFISMFFKSSKSLRFDSPKECPEGWNKGNKQGGILCIKKNFIPRLGETNAGAFILSGTSYKWIKDQENHNEKIRMFIGVGIDKISLIILFFLTLTPYISKTHKSKITKLYKKSSNKFWTLVAIVIIAYIIIQLYAYGILS